MFRQFVMLQRIINQTFTNGSILRTRVVPPIYHTIYKGSSIFKYVKMSSMGSAIPFRKFEPLYV